MADYVTPVQAADMLGVHYDSVLAMLRRGDIQGRKIGRRWYVPTDNGLPIPTRKYGGF